MAHIVVLSECQFLVPFITYYRLGIQDKPVCDCFILFPLQTTEIHYLPLHKGVCIVLGHYQHCLFNAPFFVCYVIISIVFNYKQILLFQSLIEHATAATKDLLLNNIYLFLDRDFLTDLSHLIFIFSHKAFTVIHELVYRKNY